MRLSIGPLGKRAAVCLGAAGAFVLVSWLAGGRVSVAQEPAKKVTGPRYPKTDMAVGYDVDAHWPHKPIEVKWGDMPGIAVDAHDHVWTFNRGDVPVQVYAADGAAVRAWGQGQVKSAHHIRIDREGNVWLSDIGWHVVRKFTPDGRLLVTLGTQGESGDDENHLNMPTDMAIAPSGDVFVADGYGNNRVVHFDPRGRFAKAWGRLGVAPGEFSLPHAIAMDSKGRLYIADRNNARVQVFEQSGRFVAQWLNVVVPWGIWITAKDEIYVCGSSPARWGKGEMLGIPPKDQVVVKFAPDGRVLQLAVFPKGNDGHEHAGELNWVHAVAVDSRGNLYAGDIMGKRAQKFVRLEPASPAREPTVGRRE